jgi:mersacidin/lichenicidin family type 2 lantibiotic
MSTDRIIRSWKDEEYRLSLSESELAALPTNPAGAIELSDGEMEQAAGGTLSHWLSCLPYCVNTLVGPIDCFPDI